MESVNDTNRRIREDGRVQRRRDRDQWRDEGEKPKGRHAAMQKACDQPRLGIGGPNTRAHLPHAHTQKKN